LSLPGILGTTLASVPAEVPYLLADPQRIDHWRGVLAGWAGFKIGIAWQGSRLYRRDAQRSIPLECFAPVAEMPGVQLISLQKGDGTEQIASLAGQMAIVELGPQLDEAGAFVDTAAVMKNLDLVITSDTAIAHLAGGLGVPVWVALPWLPDWRWLLEREDSPWYPTMRLFRQPALDDWPAVIGRVAGQLRQGI
jgi:ADP-heptose:LPS heptosyltransferase